MTSPRSPLLRDRRPALLALCFGVVTLAAIAAGCAELRSVTSPPDFRQLQGSDIRSAMRSMAVHVRSLDDALRDAELEEEEKQARVLAALDGISQAAGALRPAGTTLSHTMLDERLPQFLRDVEGARAAAAVSPPQYFLAGSVAGSCMACHRGR
jgi:hypothetical protein